MPAEVAAIQTGLGRLEDSRSVNCLCDVNASQEMESNGCTVSSSFYSSQDSKFPAQSVMMLIEFTEFNDFLAGSVISRQLEHFQMG